MHAVCVYCGSSSGDDAAFANATRALGTELARRAITLVYGGGSVGLMDVCANAALSAGGRVVGVIPELLLQREVAHLDLSELHVVQTMHQRKKLMADFADGFIALPGGIGTLEELFEAWTWNQLGYHNKPLGLLNVEGYFDPLLAFLASSMRRGFVRAEVLARLQVDTDPARLLQRMTTGQTLAADPWWQMRDEI